MIPRVHPSLLPSGSQQSGEGKWGQAGKQFAMDWALQFQEHGEFLKDLIDPKKAAALHKAAAKLEQDWKKFNEGPSQAPSEHKKLVQKHDALLEKVIAKKKTGADIGPLFLALALHMRDESWTYQMVQVGQITWKEEFQMAQEENASHTQLLAQLIDPYNTLQKAERDQALETGKAIEAAADPQEALRLMAKSDAFAKKFVEQLEKGERLALIAVKMIRHELRESQIFKRRLALQGGKE